MVSGINEICRKLASGEHEFTEHVIRMYPRCGRSYSFFRPAAEPHRECRTQKRMNWYEYVCRATNHLPIQEQSPNAAKLSALCCTIASTLCLILCKILITITLFAQQGLATYRQQPSSFEEQKAQCLLYTNQTGLGRASGALGGPLSRSDALRPWLPRRRQESWPPV
jgi:hypothetical protein